MLVNDYQLSARAVARTIHKHVETVSGHRPRANCQLHVVFICFKHHSLQQAEAPKHESEGPLM